MCNRYRLSVKQSELLVRYGIEAAFPADETYPPGNLNDLFPENLGWIVRTEGTSRVLDQMRWGFPHQVAGASGKMLSKSVTNVRNLKSPFWRSALRNCERRCLVPFTEFSEYGIVRGPDGRLPLHWFRVPSRPIVSFAGVWRPGDDGGNRFAFLTCEPNTLVGAIHPKAMPVLLHEEDEERWLQAPWDEAAAIARAFPDELMEMVEPTLTISKAPAKPSDPGLKQGELW